MKNTIVIPLPLASAGAKYSDVTLNKYIGAERANKYVASKLKRAATENCRMWIRKAMNDGLTWEWPAEVWFAWHVPNRRIDPDNIAFQHKFVLDGMQAAQLLPNDNMAHIRALHDTFAVVKAGQGYVEISQEGRR